MKRRPWLKWSIPLVALAGLGVVLLARPSAESREFSRSYDELRLGMPQGAVRAGFGAEPDFVCEFGSSSIWYFRSPPDMADRVADTRGELDPSRHKSGTVYTSLADLPQPYDHVTVAFGPDDKLHAYTWIGEEYHIHTKRGAVGGSDFSELTAADF